MRSSIVVLCATNASADKISAALRRTALTTVTVSGDDAPKLGAHVYVMVSDRRRAGSILRTLVDAGFPPRAVLDGATQDHARLTQVIGALTALPWDGQAEPSAAAAIAPAAVATDEEKKQEHESAQPEQPAPQPPSEPEVTSSSAAAPSPSAELLAPVPLVAEAPPASSAAPPPSSETASRVEEVPAVQPIAPPAPQESARA